MTVAVRFVTITSAAIVVALSSTQIAADSPSVARGKYIVEGVAMCGRCHSPAVGENEIARPLSGGPVPIRPISSTNNWAETAPRLAGTPPGTDEQIVRLLTTGISRTGRPPRAPMPQFRMNRVDAQSVVEYLRSLK